MSSSVVKRIEEAVRMAEELAREKGGSFEGWLWYLLQPPIFVVMGGEIVIEYPNLDYTLIARFIVDRRTHKVRYEEEEIDIQE